MIDCQRVFPQGVYARFIVKDALPRTAIELARWQQRIADIPNAELRRQARASINGKRFHAEGGSVYAALAPKHKATLIALIVALQTISDYLDNLCDRSVSMDEADFRQLHQAMLDAVDGTDAGETNETGTDDGEPDVAGAGPDTDGGDQRPTPIAFAEAKTSTYYRRHPNKDDGGYLQALVDECRRQTARLPSYDTVRPYVRQLVALYNDLQVYKHGPLNHRVETLEAWHARRDASPLGDGPRDSGKLYWWEFAAASGSTLAVFALFAAACRPELTDDEAAAVVDSYFPWICGLHILLDYLIDQAEDAAGGDLNLVSFYKSPKQMEKRLVLFVKEALRRASRLPERSFHTTVVQGLPGLYLSDAKVAQQRMQPLARTLLRAAGPASYLYYTWCRWRRRVDPLAKPPMQAGPPIQVAPGYVGHVTATKWNGETVPRPNLKKRGPEGCSDGPGGR